MGCFHGSAAVFAHPPRQPGRHAAEVALIPLSENFENAIFPVVRFPAEDLRSDRAEGSEASSVVRAGEFAVGDPSEVGPVEGGFDSVVDDEGFGEWEPCGWVDEDDSWFAGAVAVGGVGMDVVFDPVCWGEDVDCHLAGSVFGGREVGRVSDVRIGLRRVFGTIAHFNTSEKVVIPARVIPARGV